MSFTISHRIQQIISTLEDARVELSYYTAVSVNNVANYAIGRLAVRAPYDEQEDNMIPNNEWRHLDDSFVFDAVMQTDRYNAFTSVRTEEPIKYTYVTEGTEELTPIIPVEKQVLWWPDAEHPTPYVSGQEPNPFQKDALSDVQGELTNIVEIAITPVVDILKEL